MALLLGLAGAQWGSGPLAFWPWMIGGAAITALVFFDAAGIVAPMASDAEALAFALGIKSLPGLLAEKPLGRVSQDPDLCIGCGLCLDICPLAVFEKPLEGKKPVTVRPGACFSCGACVLQCPSGALSLAGKAARPGG
ncbi:MAG: ferredoxin family protein [Pseudomonadota bacterium]